jgi:hypothetical protein
VIPGSITHFGLEEEKKGEEKKRGEESRRG